MTERHQLEQTLRKLKLSGMLDTLPARLEQAQAGELGHLEFLQALCEDEIARRAHKSLRERLRRARFEEAVTLEEFDFRFNPKTPTAQIRDLATCLFVERGESVLLYGPVGPGSHCPPRGRHWSNSPALSLDALILRPFRRPLVTWTACSSPRWTLCKTVWRATPSRLAASSSGT
jgi:hypothetical protein